MEVVDLIGVVGGRRGRVAAIQEELPQPLLVGVGRHLVKYLLRDRDVAPTQ